MWLGERITEFGLENGVSLIIFTGIAVELPGEIAQKVTLFRKDELGLGQLALFFLVIILCFYIVTFIERAFRSIPVQYAKRVVNNQVYGGTQSLPMRVDTGGVMPAILASSVLAFPATISAFISQENFLYKYIETIMSSLNAGNLLYNLLFSFLILYMTYFYAPIQFKTNKISEMLQKNNAFIPGIRPGEKTKAFLDFVLDRLSFFGALFLILICVTPGILISGTTRFGGTALLILVSVSIRVVMNIQAFMFSDKYENAHRSKGKYNGPNRRF
jgi:preprotein translocase subunit SecY